MYAGFDIGTTKVCAVVVDGKGETVYSESFPNGYEIPSSGPEKTQDAERIAQGCAGIYRNIQKKYRVESVGISTQMHGILYYDADGKALSPLYTWQDGRGNLPFRGKTYAGILKEASGYDAASGYGSVSVFFDALNGLIPSGAKGICTVGDYLAMKLTGNTEALVHATNGASIGLYKTSAGAFDLVAAEKAGLPSGLFPRCVSECETVGYAKGGAAVACCIGDNQASIYGALKDPEDAALNVGTGSQISVVTDKTIAPGGCEIRPFFNGKNLLIGCPLCGGYAYELLKRFFESVTGGTVPYDVMNEWAESAMGKNVPVTATCFNGTRENPFLRASISELDSENFNAPALAYSVLKGMSGELAGCYEKIKQSDGRRKNLIGTGNAVRKNKTFRKIICEDFGMKLLIPQHTEEAAYGAALLAAESCCGKSLKRFIKYSDGC
ncbi:MAG: sedoheptulokinase [Candidatus Gallimonas sp.]